MAIDAATDALETAELTADDLDLIIYVGVGRGAVEPSHASLVQHQLGARSATAFDILDACVSWLRALEVVQALFNADRYKTALVVNCEAGMTDFGQFELASPSDLDRYLAGLTVGEAATATVLTADGPDIDVIFATEAEHHDLCMIPLKNIARFAPAQSEQIEPEKFYSYSTDLLSACQNLIMKMFAETPWLAAPDYDISVIHSVSARFSDRLLEALNLPADRHFDIHRDYGNTVSASVPLALSLAIDQRQITRGDRVLVISGGAGISIGLSLFTF